jgi:hypothetical protein
MSYLMRTFWKAYIGTRVESLPGTASAAESAADKLNQTNADIFIDSRRTHCSAAAAALRSSATWTDQPVSTLDVGFCLELKSVEPAQSVFGDTAAVQVSCVC